MKMASVDRTDLSVKIQDIVEHLREVIQYNTLSFPVEMDIQAAILALSNASDSLGADIHLVRCSNCGIMTPDK